MGLCLFTDVPLAPEINSTSIINDTEDLVSITWSHNATIDSPVDAFEVIIKQCSKEPCSVNPESIQSDDKVFRVSAETFQSMVKVDFDKNSIYSVAVCAINELGKNCSSSYSVANPSVATLKLITQMPVRPTYIVWLVVLCVALFLILCCLFIASLAVCCCRHREGLLQACCDMKDGGRSYAPSKAFSYYLFPNVL